MHVTYMQLLRAVASSILTLIVIVDTNASLTTGPYDRVFNVLASIKLPQFCNEGGSDFREALPVRTVLSAAL